MVSGGSSSGAAGGEKKQLKKGQRVGEEVCDTLIIPKEEEEGECQSSGGALPISLPPLGHNRRTRIPYVPADKEEEEIIRLLDEMTREEDERLSHMKYPAFRPLSDYEMPDDKLIETYIEQVIKSQGFDVDCFPGGEGSTYKPLINFRDDPELENLLVSLSKLALDQFNIYKKATDQGVPYVFKEVDHATRYIGSGYVYLITFIAQATAADASGEVKTFQAKVFDPIDPNAWPDKVLMVRRKDETVISRRE